MDEPGIEDEPGGFIAIVGHFRRRPRNGQAQGEMAGARYDRASRTMGPSLHPYVYNPPQIPAMSEALGRDWRPWAPEQAGSSIGAELTPTQTDRGHLSGPDVAMRTAPPASSPKSAAWEIEKAPFEECSGHEDDSPA